MSKYTCRCIAVSLLTKVRCDNCHVFTIMISRSDDILRKVCHTIQTNYFMKMHKRSKLLVKLTKDGAWMVFDWSTDQDCITKLILSKDALIVFFSLAYLSQVTWPCLLFWYISECNTCAMAKNTICKWKHFSAICSTRYNKGYISPILHNFSHNQ